MQTYETVRESVCGNVWEVPGELPGKCLGKCLGSVLEVASARTRTLDLVGEIRQRRYRWLGHILSMPDNRLLKEAIKVQFDMGLPGSIFMDAPRDLSFRQLELMARDRDKWRAGLPALAHGSTHDEQNACDHFQREYERLRQQESIPPHTHTVLQNQTTGGWVGAGADADVDGRAGVSAAESDEVASIS